MFKNALFVVSAAVFSVVVLGLVAIFRLLRDED
jgi:hypothetical protein